MIEIYERRSSSFSLSLSLIAVTVFVVRSMEMKKAVHSARETGSPVKLRSAWHPEKKGKKKRSRCWFHGNYRGHVDETLLRRVCPLRETGFLEGRDFFPNFVAAVENWTENRIEKKWEKKGVAKESGRDTYVEGRWFSWAYLTGKGSVLI